MAGQIHAAIQKIIVTRGKGNRVIENGTKTKLLLKGINASKWTSMSPDDPVMMSKVKQAAFELGVSI
jgi:hypothetical protein